VHIKFYHTFLASSKIGRKIKKRYIIIKSKLKETGNHKVKVKLSRYTIQGKGGAGI
jgi:ribosomal protein L9